MLPLPAPKPDRSKADRLYIAGVLKEALYDCGVSVRRFADLCEVHQTVAQEWLADGHNRLPMWSLARVPSDVAFRVAELLANGRLKVGRSG